ncbi:MAG: PepSY domain-containing protein, partial [Nitrosomonas sp. PRO5]|nr:PepSY domain-containing protein [Nitrosomonas sp. PRO5]
MSSESAHQHAAGVDEERGTLPRRSWRQLWLSIHLYLGLFIGALLVILGLTGSIAVFWVEIDEWLNPELLTVTVPEQKNTAQGAPVYRSLDEIVSVARQAATPDSRITTVYGARNSEAVYAVYASQPSGAWQRIFVDPYRAQVTGVRSYGANEWIPNYFMDVIFQLHFSLLLGMNGQTLVAICALLLLISLITGLIVWWPASGQWHKALTIKWGAGPVRFNFDLHKTLSFYLFPVLGAVLLSGVFMNLNEPFVWVTQLFSPATRQPQHT